MTDVLCCTKPACVRSYSRHVRVRLHEGSFQYNSWVRYWSRILLGRVFGLLTVLSFERTIEIRIQVGSHSIININILGRLEGMGRGTNVSLGRRKGALELDRRWLRERKAAA